MATIDSTLFAASVALAPGAKVGDYQLVRPIARGGMGEVWEAHRKDKPDDRVAVKMLKPGDSDPAWLRRFLDEARIGATIDHPNVVRTLDLGLGGSRLFLVMELLEGLGLDKAVEVEGGPLPMGMVVGIGLQALAGLHHAHETLTPGGKPLLLVHRDIKPSNLVLTSSGTVKLIDFGVSRALAFDATSTRTGIVRGSVPYFSPEQARDEPLDPRTDVYSLGLVLHELLTGKRVWTAPNEAALLGLILFGALPKVRAKRPEVPASLDYAVAAMTERQRADRPVSAEAAAELLASAIPKEEIWDSGRLAEWMAKHASVVAKVRPTATFDLPVDPQMSPSDAARAMGASTSRERQLPRLGILGLGTLAGIAVVLFAWRISRPKFQPAPEPVAVVGAEAPATKSPGGAVTPAEVETAPEDPPATAAAATGEAGASEARPAPGAGEAAPSAPAQGGSATSKARGSAAATSAKSRPAPGTPKEDTRASSESIGWLTVDAQPTWARIWVDGRDLGPTPIYRHPIAAGKHKVEARRADGLVARQTLKVAQGKELKHVFKW